MISNNQMAFYFVSEAPKFKKISFFLSHFSNLQISMDLTLFLHRINGLLLKYDVIIVFSGTSSGFFPDFSGFF